MLGNNRIKIYAVRRDAMFLLKTIGLPRIIEGKDSSLFTASNLLQLAKLNKIPLLYLESIRKDPSFGTHLSYYRDRLKKTVHLTTLVSNLLEEQGIHYTIFKTLKPFPYTPSDIDVLLLSIRDISKVSQILLKKNGFKQLDNDPYGLTMFSVDHNLNIDLTTEVAVSSFIYLDKNLLFNNTNQVKVCDSLIQMLNPYADLVVIAAHCMYKEQMFTLSDYYTFTLLQEYYFEALKLAEIAHVKFALQLALKLTHDITINAFGSDNTLIEKLRKSLETFEINVNMRTEKCIDLPMKYHHNTILKGISKKVLEDPISRNSIPLTLKSAFQSKFFNKLLNHITRKGY